MDKISAKVDVQLAERGQVSCKNMVVFNDLTYFSSAFVVKYPPFCPKTLKRSEGTFTRDRNFGIPPRGNKQKKKNKNVKNRIMKEK